MNTNPEPNADGNGISDEQEDALFDEVSAQREQGASLRVIAGGSDADAGAGGATGGVAAATDDAKGKGAEGDDSRKGAEAQGATGEGETDEASAAREAAEAADKGKAAGKGAEGETAEAKAAREAAERQTAENAAREAAAGKKDGAAGSGEALTVAGVETIVESLRGEMESLGDLVVEPAGTDADGKDQPAITLKDFSANYPGVMKVVLTAIAMAANKGQSVRSSAEFRYVQERMAAEHRDSLLNQIDGDGDGKVAGAREIADSPKFAQWYGQQPAAIQQLGQSSKTADAVKLLRLFCVDTGFKPSKAAAAQGGSRSEAERKELLSAARAGGTGGGRKPAAIGEVHSRNGGQETFTINEDDADAEFNRLAAERAAAKR